MSLGADSGTIALWTGFGFSLFATTVFSAITLLKAGSKGSDLASLATVIVAITALAYLIQALNGSISAILGPNGYELQWLRYAQWALNTPMLVGTLGLLAGTTISELFFTTAFSLLVTGGLFAAAISSGANATWPIFAFAVVAAVPIVYQVLVTWAARAAAGPKATKAVYTVLSYLGFALAIGYTVNWGTAEGGQKQDDVIQETITYTVFDIISRVVFGFILLFAPGAIEGAAGIISAPAASVVVKVEEAASAAAPATV